MVNYVLVVITVTTHATTVSIIELEEKKLGVMR